MQSVNQKTIFLNYFLSKLGLFIHSKLHKIEIRPAPQQGALRDKVNFRSISLFIYSTYALVIFFPNEIPLKEIICKRINLCKPHVLNRMSGNCILLKRKRTTPSNNNNINRVSSLQVYVINTVKAHSITYREKNELDTGHVDLLGRTTLYIRLYTLL